MKEPIEIETGRLRLRRWRESDLGPFAAINADPRVMEYFPEPLGRRASDAMAERIRALIERRGWGLWALEVKGGEPFVGFVGLNVPPTALPFSPCVEIGWRLAAAHWGRGYASEAAVAVLQVAFERLDLSEVVSFTAAVNERSQRVMRRIGMRFHGETFEHPDVPEGSPLRPHVLYRLGRGQWSSGPRPHILRED